MRGAVALLAVVCLGVVCLTVFGLTVVPAAGIPGSAQAAPAPSTTGTAPSTSTTEALLPSAPPPVHARSAALVELDTGRTLYARRADVRAAMGSTAKIMTALLVLDTLPLDREVTVSARAANIGEQSVGLKAGDRLTVEQLLYGALVHSGNDAAFALAEACCGSMEAFVGRMNEKAWKLGLTNTHYVNPDGLDAPGEYSSAGDLAALARVAMERPPFCRMVGTVSYSLSLPGATTPVTFRNVNRLLGKVDWVTGVKTGSTGDAGFCLVASGTRDGVSMISVVLGEPDWNSTWADSRSLLEYGFAVQQPRRVWTEAAESWRRLVHRPG
jgi:serine-type D-Ala-D-Ala carboxypeptidase (penicillin-binding protein 5/6)